eukprot:1181535-Rhodomonas_salina.1
MREEGGIGGDERCGDERKPGGGVGSKLDVRSYLPTLRSCLQSFVQSWPVSTRLCQHRSQNVSYLKANSSNLKTT